MTGENGKKGNGFGLDETAGDENSPYAHQKEEEVRSFYALCLATLLLAAPFGLAVILLERPMDDPILISVYFWLGLAAIIYYPFLILRSPPDIYIADAYDDTATRTSKIVGVLLFAYALMWGANLLLLTNTAPWRTAQGPLARIEIIPTPDEWAEERVYEFRFQLTNVPGWFHYQDPDPNRIQQIYDLLMQVERAGPFIMEDDEEDTLTPNAPIPIEEALKQAEKAAPKPAKGASNPAAAGTETAEAGAPPPAGTDTPAVQETADVGTPPKPPRLSVGFRADHGWINAVMPPAWAFLGENTRMDVKALMVGEELLVYDKSRAIGLRITSLIWFVMCVMAGSASLLAAKLRSLKGQEAEAYKRHHLSRRAEETRAFEARLAELGIDEDHLTEMQKSARINPVHKKSDRPQ